MLKNKKAILMLSVLVLTLAVGFFPSNYSTRAQNLFEGKIMAFYNVYTAVDQSGPSVADFMDWWTSNGGGAQNITDLTADTLGNVHCLILNCPDADQDESHAITNFTMAQAQAVRDWFLNTSIGHKFLWSSADSAFTIAGLEESYRPNNASMMLEVLGSVLRYEPTSVEDPDYNTGGGPYRPILNTTGTDPEIASCVENVTAVLAHSPTLLYGLDGTTPVALEDTTLPNVYPIMMTGAAGIINDPTPLDPMYAHTNGEEGHFVIVAAELGIGGTTHKLVASGCAPIGGYNPMWFDEHRGSILNGSLFIKQTVTYGMTPPLVPPPPIPGFPIEAIVLGLLATLGLGLALRHRRRK